MMCLLSKIFSKFWGPSSKHCARFCCFKDGRPNRDSVLVYSVLSWGELNALRDSGFIF